VNDYTEGLPSPLVAGDDGGMFSVDPAEVQHALDALARTRAERDAPRVASALAELERAARAGDNMMEASIECALARVTTGEWADVLRAVFGEYRAVTGIDGQTLALDSGKLAVVRARVEAYRKRTGHRPRMVVAKPGLDGHSNGAEVIAVSARDAGFEVVYLGIRSTPAEIVATAVEEDADVVGISVLSGSHLELAREVIGGLADANAGDIAVVLGGIVPPTDVAALTALGVSRVFTPADYELVDVIGEVLAVVEARNTTSG
jgi:(2R)-ethylmalonyl-CoA mutase